MNDIAREVFPEEAALVDAGDCPFCQEAVDPRDFKDQLSIREFKISGLCQKCQDKMFG